MDQHVGGEALGEGRQGFHVHRTAVCERARRRRRLLSAQDRDHRGESRHRGQSARSRSELLSRSIEMQTRDHAAMRHVELQLADITSGT